MKLKIIVKIIERIFGMTYKGEECRADMYLPDRLLAMALVYFAGGIGFAVYSIFNFKIWFVIIAVIGVILGIMSLLCWKNQTIYIISDDEFIYSTMFGKKHTYSFSDIQYLRKNRDSMTLFLTNGKVHIESMAILSERLIQLIDNALEKNRPVYICEHIIKDNEPILFVKHDEDGDWQFLCGKDHSSDVPCIITLAEAIEIDKSVCEILHLQEGQTAVRDDKNSEWKM